MTTIETIHPGKTVEIPEAELTINSPKRLARTAGIFYLLVGIVGKFAEGYLDPKIYVANDAAATVGNLLTNSTLVRIGVVAHMMNAVFFILTAMTLYILLKHVNKTVARTMLVFVALSAGITTLNAVFQFVGLRIATDSTYATAFGVAGSNALAQIFLEIQHYGTLSAQVFFGLWLVPLGYLAYKSRLFPRVLGYVLIAAAGPT